MSFLFGDLSPAPFGTNFLEELRDALDFAGGIAKADQIVVTADARRAAMRQREEEEHGRLEALGWAMITAAGASDQGEADSATAHLAAELGKLVLERREISDASVRAKLEADLLVLGADVGAARQDYFPTLQDWLLVRVPPSSKQTWSVELIPGAKKDLHRYRAVLAGESTVGLVWTIELALAEDGIWSAPLRVSRLAEDLAIVTPQVTGLIKKEIKSKKQKIDRHWITGVVDDGESIQIELREEVGQTEGFTVTVGPGAVALVRNGAADDPTVGTFPVAEEDETALRELGASVRDMVRSFPKQRLGSATFDGLPFDGTTDAQPKLVGLVPRLVESLAPTVAEIVSRSRSDAELVLRRLLNDGRREELFMPKARLLEKLASLDEGHQKLFAAVTNALSPKKPSEPSVKAATSAVPTVRSEVAHPEPPYIRRRSSGAMNAVVAPLLKETPRPRPPTYSSPTLEISESDEDEEAAEEALRDSIAPPSSRTATLKDALKQARTAAKENRLDDAFRQYGTVFGSGSFSSTRPDDQRQALKLMFFGTQPNFPNEEVKNAYRVTLPILQALVLKDRDPADYELLGMAYVVLDEPAKATEIFKKALEVERSRNPASDLCGNLMRRVSQL